MATITSQQQQRKENPIDDEENKIELNSVDETPTTTATEPTPIDGISGNSDGNEAVKATATATTIATTNEIATVFATNTVTAITNNCNQETDLAAMSTKAVHDIPPVNLIATTATTATTTLTTTTAATTANTSISSAAIPSYISNETVTATATTSNHQFVTPQKPLHASSLSASSSASASAAAITKKKHNKFSKCFSGGNNNIGGGDHDSSSSSLTNTIANAAASSLSSSPSIAAASSANMKTSLSMTSLPPDEKQESRDGIKAKLKVERPYNSLKVSQIICFHVCFVYTRIFYLIFLFLR